MKRVFIKTIFLFTVLTGCIRETLSDCRATVSLTFELLPLCGATPDQVKSLDVYVFDWNNRFVRIQHEDNVRLTDDYILQLPLLPAGRYKVVVWGNQDSHYSTSGEFIPKVTGDMENQLLLNIPADNTLKNTDLAPLLFGQATAIDIYPGKDVTRKVLLDNDTYTINFTVEGLTASDSDYEFGIADSNSRYMFDNTIADAPQFRYVRTVRLDDSGTLAGTLNVLRLTADRFPVVSLVNATQQKQVLTGTLTELVSKAILMGADIDYSTTHTFDILIKLGTDMSVTVIINGWELSDEETIMS
ncbi:MAG: FimB/Mfa2 family fimbrial subunit [Bacteroidales bacterium]|jgi:hypothetical protein|nr:FimB/Mfa2 family fimbrial subunit [Bacteroidales bacterium]